MKFVKSNFYCAIGISNLKVHLRKCLFLKGIIVRSDEKKEKEKSELWRPAIHAFLFHIYGKSAPLL